MWLVYAFLAAGSFGIRGILYHWTAQRSIDRNAMLFGVFVTGAVVSLAGAWATDQQWSVPTLMGVAMGVCSYIANASVYKGFAVGKASVVAVLTALPAVVVALLAFLLWGETIAGWQLAAFGLILVSVLLIRYSNDLSLNRLQGAQWGLLAMLFFAFNDLTSKQSTLLEADPMPTLFYMFLTGALLFAASRQIGLRRESTRGGAASASVSASTSASASGWSFGRTFLWGLLVGFTNAFGMIFILLAFERGVTGLVSAVVALNVVVILGYTRLFLKETFRRLEVAGIGIALLGVALLQWAS